MLIILDTCRPDALKRVAPEFDFIDDVDKRWSVGSTSMEWILNTFDRQYKKEIAKTAYITSNPHAMTVLENGFERKPSGELGRSSRRIPRYSVSEPVSPDAFHTYITLYDMSKNEYPSPRAVTNHTIKTDRHDNPGRIIAHYMPPHTPYLARMEDGQIEISDESRSYTDFDAYLDNLRWALTEVELLLDNVDRDRVIISADHGENFFLRSIRGRHPAGMIDPAVRRVPWAKTSAVNKNTHQPDDFEQERAAPEEILEALGYL